MRTVVLKYQCASESPGGLIKALVLDPTLEFPIQRSGMGLENCLSKKFPGDAATAGTEKQVKQRRHEDANSKIPTVGNSSRQTSHLSLGGKERKEGNVWILRDLRHT